MVIYILINTSIYIKNHREQHIAKQKKYEELKNQK